MEHLIAAQKHVEDLVARIALLEKQNAEKDVEIRRLSVVGGAAPLAPAAAEPAAAEPAGAAAAPVASVASTVGGARFTRIKIPNKKEPTAAERESLTVYEDDVALGTPAPNMDHIEWFNGDAVHFGKGKPVVLTFFSKLNKGDFGTLSLLSEISEEFKGEVDFCAVSRDGEAEDVSKFPGKYHGKYFDELQSPDGKPGLTVYMNFPLGFDPSGGFNQQFKQSMKKATLGVGITILVDGQGKVAWYEHFVRGNNPMCQLAEQIRHLIKGEPLLSNGPAPEVQSVEESIDLPDEVDPFAKTGKY